MHPIPRASRATLTQPAGCRDARLGRTLRAVTATVLVACGLWGAAPAHANDDLERVQLARVTFELERLQQMVAEAGRKAPTGQRLQFRYDWLARDLELVRRGIEDHMDAPRQPRPVVPLRGDYRY